MKTNNINDINNINAKKYKTYTDLALEFKRTKSEKSYKLLYKKVLPGLRNYLSKILHNNDDVDDIISLTMITIYKKIDTYDEHYQISTWIYKIAYNATLNLLKERNKKVYLSSMEDEISDIVLNNNTEIENDEEKEIIKDKYIKILLNELEDGSIESVILKYKYIENLSRDQILDKLNHEHMLEYEKLCQKCLEFKDTNKILYFKYLKEKQEYKDKNFYDILYIKNKLLAAKIKLKKVLLEKIKANNI